MLAGLRAGGRGRWGLGASPALTDGPLACLRGRKKQRPGPGLERGGNRCTRSCSQQTAVSSGTVSEIAGPRLVSLSLGPQESTPHTGGQQALPAHTQKQQVFWGPLLKLHVGDTESPSMAHAHTPLRSCPVLPLESRLRPTPLTVPDTPHAKAQDQRHSTKAEEVWLCPGPHSPAQQRPCRPARRCPHASPCVSTCHTAREGKGSAGGAAIT